jgi:hypothetical protein
VTENILRLKIKFEIFTRTKNLLTQKFILVYTVMDTMQILTPLNILEPKLKKLNLSQSSNK